MLANRRVAAVPRGVGSATAVYAARAENAELWDVEGKRYIDFAGGIAVLNVGHRHPKVIEAAKRQLDLYTHTAFQVAPYEPYILLAERLNRLAPLKGETKTILFTTGAEATENAIKIARAATGRSGVIALRLPVLDVIEEEGLVARANVIGTAIKTHLARLARRSDIASFGGVRGLGAMIGFDLAASPADTAGAVAKRVCARALASGLILLTCGAQGETVRLLVPLTVSDAVLQEGLDILEGALAGEGSCAREKRA